MDALSEVLSHVRLKDTNWACFVASSPWGISFRETKGCVRFHYVSRGGCWLSVDKSSQPRIALSSGDLAVLPQGHGHSIRDQPRSHPTKFDELLRRTERAPSGVVHHIKVGGAGAETSMIYGAFMIDDPFETPMLATLPSVIPLLAVPISIVGTFGLLLALGFTINTLTLFGLVLAIGIVVDDAIVVVENVERHIEAGLAPRDAAHKAMSEVSSPIIAVAMVLCAVFVPMTFMRG